MPSRSILPACRNTDVLVGVLVHGGPGPSQGPSAAPAGPCARRAAAAGNPRRPARADRTHRGSHRQPCAAGGARRTRQRRPPQRPRGDRILPHTAKPSDRARQASSDLAATRPNPPASRATTRIKPGHLTMDIIGGHISTLSLHTPMVRSEVFRAAAEVRHIWYGRPRQIAVAFLGTRRARSSLSTSASLPANETRRTLTLVDVTVRANL
jgi:hypothetical protein